MAGGLGVLGYVGYGPESSGGVAVVPAAYIQAGQEGVSAEFDRYDLFNIASRLSEPDDRAGVLRVAGDVTAPFHPLVAGHWCKGAFGSATVSTTGVATGFYKHTWKTPILSQWDNRFALPPYTFEIFRDVGSAQQYAGCNINRFELSMAPNGVMQCKIGIIGVSFTNKAATTASYSTIDILDWTVASLTLNSAAVADWESFSFVWDNGLEGIPTLAARNTIYKIRRSGSPTNRFEFNVGFEDITYLEQFRQQSEGTLQLYLTPPATSHFFKLEFPRIVYTAFPTGMGGRGRQMANVSGQFRYLQSAATSFIMDLATNVGSY